MTWYRRRTAGLSVDRWLGILGIVFAGGLAIFGVEHLPTWTYFALILVVVVAIVILLRISKDNIGVVDEIHVDVLRQRSGQLGYDIYTFLDDRDRARAEVPGYDEETVRQYHLRFGPQLLQIAKQAEDMGALGHDVKPLRDKQRNLREIRQLAGYLKSGIAINSQL